MVSVLQNDLLSHFLRHYADLGIDLARRATFALHVPPEPALEAEVSLNATRALLAQPNPNPNPSPNPNPNPNQVELVGVMAVLGVPEPDAAFCQARPQP